MKIGFNCSSFDMFHAGHVTMLKMEKQLCDYLIVALQVDPTVDRPGIKNKPVQSVYERYVQLQACKYVDEILVYETEFDLLQLIMTQTMNIRFLSEEYEHRDFTGKQYCIDNNIELHYHKRKHSYSSTEIRERTARIENEKNLEFTVATKQYDPELIK
jgi:glycerol-3-phosphate cytidylyltransferase